MTIYKVKTIASSFRMWLLFSFVILLFFPSRNNLLAQDWEELKPGVAKQTFTVSVVDDGSTFEVTAVRIDPAKAEIKVIDMYGTLSEQKVKFPVYSLAEVYERMRPIAIINGGFSGSLSLPVAAGLVVENAQVITRLNKVSRLQSGILGISANEIKIIRREEYEENTFRFAIQSGPLIIEPNGNIGIYRSERQKEKFRRSVIALDKKDRLLLITTTDVHLFDLASFLKKAEVNGGLECKVALNLSGDTQSGLIITQEGSPVEIGNVNAIIPSAIGIFLE